MKIDYSKISPLVCLLYLWQLPQVIASLFLLIFIHSDISKYTNEHTGMTVFKIEHSFRSCWSMGPFIFVHRNQPDYILRHETGHSVQSVYLGLVYLLVIGIPSATLLTIRRRKNKSSEWYYSHYPENWANRLGGVRPENNR